MQIVKHETHQESSQWVVDQIIQSLQAKPDSVVCMASGHSPALACELLIHDIKFKKIDCSKLFFIGLDEWVGMPPDDSGSCKYFFDQNIIRPLNLLPHQYHFYDSLSNNLEEECEKMNEIIASHPIDIMVVGIGMNGHIGFNEPGTSFASKAHVADLDETTTTVGQKYFTEAKKLDKGITIGLGQLLEAKKVLLIANGEKKAQVIKAAVRGEITESFPASVMQLHSNGYITLDLEAGSLIG